MAKFKVWAQSITDVYLIVEAEDKKRAKEIAEEADGGDFTSTPYGDWIIGNVEEVSA